MKRPLKILIVDDDAEFRYLVGLAAANVPCRIDEAGTGRLGMEKFRAEDYDLVILDLRLPCAEGDEILRKMRELRPEQPVLILSGYVAAEIGRRLTVSDPKTDFAEKPNSYTALCNLLSIETAKFCPQI